jgi:hypothetical protein
MTKLKSPDLMQENEMNNEASTPAVTTTTSNSSSTNSMINHHHQSSALLSLVDQTCSLLSSDADAEPTSTPTTPIPTSELITAPPTPITTATPLVKDTKPSNIFFYMSSKHINNVVTSSDELESTSTSASISTSTSPPTDSSLARHYNQSSGAASSINSLQHQQPSKQVHCASCTNKILESELSRIVNSQILTASKGGQSGVVERSISDIFGRRFASCSCSYIFLMKFQIRD